MVAMAIWFVCAVVLGVSYSMLNTPTEFDTDYVEFSVPKGVSSRSVMERLDESGIIPNAFMLRAYAKFSLREDQIKAGEYKFDSGMTPIQVYEYLVLGKTKQYHFTIIEGWTANDLLAALHADNRIQNTFLKTDWSQFMEQVDKPGESPEGWFLPETYAFEKNTTDKQLLKRAFNDMQKALDAAWVQRKEDSPLKNPYDVLIMASIVEKETGVPAERPMIAAVFLSRLEKGMRLQTDPSVIYGMGDRYNGNIRKSDLTTDTPYNTYTRYGLTPTPISLPGKDALMAVVNPAQTDALYFVASGNGGHHFSATYEEHKSAVVKYLLGGDVSRYKGGQ